jgi:hypothetical protein
MKPAIYVGKNNKASAVYSTGKWANANMLDNSNFQVSRYGMFAEFGGLLGDGTDFPLESQVIYPVSIYSELFFEEVPSYPIVDRWIMNIEHGVGGGYLDPVVRVGKDYEQTTPIIMYTLGGDPLQTEILLWQDINPKYYNTPYDGYDPRSGDYLGYPYLARFTLTGKFCFPLEYDSNTSISIVASLVWYANDNPNNVIGYAHNAKTINASNVDSPIVMFNGEHIEIGDTPSITNTDSESC